MELPAAFSSSHCFFSYFSGLHGGNVYRIFRGGVYRKVNRQCIFFSDGLSWRDAGLSMVRYFGGLSSLFKRVVFYKNLK